MVAIAVALPGVDPFTGLPTLVFDGADNHYLALTGKVFGDVKFDRLTAGGGPSPVNALSETFLVLLTLDVRSNLPNNPTFVPLQFWNETERLTSGSTEFLCWTQVELSTGIHPDLTQVAQGTRKGEVIGGPARKIPFAGISDEAGPVTLIGLVQTIEGTAANGFQERSYIYNMFDDSIVVTTYFLPFPF